MDVPHDPSRSKDRQVTQARLGRVLRRASFCGIATIVGLTALHFPRKTDAVATHGASTGAYREFYEDSYAPPESSANRITSYEAGTSQRPSAAGTPEDQNARAVRDFVNSYALQEKRILEVGAGTGGLQDIVADYTGLDIAETARRYFHKPFVQGSATSLPFPDNSFDVVWTVAVLEHVPQPEKALYEMRRVLRNGGPLYLAPAWLCRPWAADGYAGRPYSDFGPSGKLYKASIPVLDSVVFRSLYVFPIRLLRAVDHLVTRKPTDFRYNELTPNYRHFWTSDSDAVNSMDGFESALWFTSRGDTCSNYREFVRQFFFRSGPLIIQVRKSGAPSPQSSPK